MRKIRLIAALLALLFSVTLFAQKRGKRQFVKLEMSMYPKAEKGFKQVYIQVPIKKNESDFHVEIQVGKTALVDCNKYFLSGKIVENVVDGWGYNYYSVESNGSVASTQMACLDTTKTKTFIAMESKMVRYNSKLPIVVYVPDGLEVKYRIWSAPQRFRSALLSTNDGPLDNSSSAVRSSQIEDKKWQLIELNGKKIDATPESAYVIFHSKTGKMQGKAKCNMLNYGYSIENNFRLRIDKQGISTRMACPGGIEDEFIKMLSNVDNFTTDGTYLSLNKGRVAPLARFVLVK